MKGKRTVTEDRAKIIEAKLNDPLVSNKDIGEKLGMPGRTVSHVLREDLAEVCSRSDLVAQRIDSNNRLLSLADEWIEKLTVAGEAKVSELVQVKKLSWDQNQVMTGGVTDRKSISIEDVDKLSPEQLTKEVFEKLK